MTRLINDLSEETQLIHADSLEIKMNNNDNHHIAPFISTSTTFLKIKESNTTSTNESSKNQEHIYSRMSTDTRDRLELVLSKMDHASHSFTFSSGLSALYCLLVSIKPKRIFISEGYHGSHQVINMHQQIASDTDIVIIPLHYYQANNSNDSNWAQQEEKYQDKIARLGFINNLKQKLLPFSKNDLVWIESPSNPYGHVWDLQKINLDFCGAWIAVDSTLAPPPLSYPLDIKGVDVVMHSATKYLGGHSDLLGGVLSTRSEILAKQILTSRTLLGSTMGNLECWLLLRSLRTLHLRVQKQSETCFSIVKFLNEKRQTGCELDGYIKNIHHAILSDERLYYYKNVDVEGEEKKATRNMNSCSSPMFSITFTTKEKAESVPKKLILFKNATSFGGIESLVEWRAAVDSSSDPCLVRFSVGLENVEDLEKDLMQSILSA